MKKLLPLKQKQIAISSSTFALLVLLLQLGLTVNQTLAQDILRQRINQQQQQQQPASNNNLFQQPPNQLSSFLSSASNQQQPPTDFSQLANIKLPPQLASLSPEQLLQLAKIRELQIKQQQQQQQQQQTHNRPTPRPNVVGSGQIPQPSSQNPVSPPTTLVTPPSQPTRQQSTNRSNNQNNNNQSNNNNNNDDGSYRETETEMEGVVRPASEQGGAAGGASTAAAATGSEASSSAPSAASGGAQQQQQPNSAPAAPSFEVNWNKCPQLEPSESEKGKKTQIITKCLQSAPIPTNLTRENVETHREQIATCALKVEGWFDEQGSYKYDKAEAEIRAKRLDSQIEQQVLKFHVACKQEAINKFPRTQHKLIEQVQFYQACMDYYISIVCEIEVSVDQ